jgi:hypothetical protein
MLFSLGENMSSDEQDGQYLKRENFIIGTPCAPFDVQASELTGVILFGMLKDALFDLELDIRRDLLSS